LDAEAEKLPERIADLPVPIVMSVVEMLRFMRAKTRGRLEFTFSEGALVLMSREQQKYP
jgi:hypothetical protein